MIGENEMKKASWLYPILFGLFFVIVGIIQCEILVICFGSFFVIVSLIEKVYEQIKKQGEKPCMPIATEPEFKKTDKKAVDLPQTMWVTGEIRLLSPKYSMIEKAIHILERNNFVLSKVETGGESSIHMWTMGFNRKYSTLQEFLAKAEKEYAEAWEKAAKGGGPSIEWEGTSFVLLNNSRDIQIRIRVEEDNGKGIRNMLHIILGE